MGEGGGGEVTDVADIINRFSKVWRKCLRCDHLIDFLVDVARLGTGFLTKDCLKAALALEL